MKIEDLIERLTSTGKDYLESDLLFKLEEHCNNAVNQQKDSFNYLHRLILYRLKQNHAQIRYQAFLVLNYLFQKFNLSREFVCQNLSLLSQLCMNLEIKEPKTNKSVNFNWDSDGKLPEPIVRPKSWAIKLQNKWLECFKCWYQKFGENYKQISNGYDQLVKRKLIKPPKMALKIEPAQKERLLMKFLKEFELLESQINVLINEINSCFELLIPKYDLTRDGSKNEPATNNSTLENHRPMQGLSIKIKIPSQITIRRDTSNTGLINKMKEICDKLRKFTAKLTLIESRMKKLFNASKKKEETDSGHLRKVQSLRVKIESILWKEKDFKIIEESKKKPDEMDSEDDEDDFEEVDEMSEEQLFMIKIKEQEEAGVRPGNSGKNSNNNEDLCEHRCRAQLPSGRLCPRRDKKRCPFHGPIIPRDQQGLPLDPKLKEKELEQKYQKESNEWRDKKYLKELGKQLGKDLQSTKKRNRKNDSIGVNLINLKELISTPKRRLEEKLTKHIRKKKRRQ